MRDEGIIADGCGIRKLRLTEMALGKAVPMAGVSALCAGNGRIYCTCPEAIFALDEKTMLPQRVYCGAPGVRKLLLSPDGAYLYALCADGDSIWMLSTAGAQAMVFCRAGKNPQSMAFDTHGQRLIVAGGGACCVLVFCARTMRLQKEIAMPGPVYSAAAHMENLAALCLTDTMDTMLVHMSEQDGVKQMKRMTGFPGTLLMRDQMILAAVQGHIYRVAAHGLHVLGSIDAPGCAVSLEEARGGLLYLDQWSETMYLLRSGRFVRLAEHVLAFDVS